MSDKSKKNKTSFASGNQPVKRRGKSTKTLILETLRENSYLGLRKNASNESCEKAFFAEVAKVAFNPEDKDRAMCFRLLADKGWASVKPSSELVNFIFDVEAPPHIQAAQVLKAASVGDIPPDIANMFIQSIKAMIDISEYTDLRAKIEAIEKELGLSNE